LATHVLPEHAAGVGVDQLDHLTGLQVVLAEQQHAVVRAARVNEEVVWHPALVGRVVEAVWANVFVVGLP
jgi:hypothetical protein